VTTPSKRHEECIPKGLTYEELGTVEVHTPSTVHMK